MMRSLRFGSALLFVFAACGHQADTEEGGAAGQGADSAEVTSDEGSTLALVTDGSEAAQKAYAPTSGGVALYMSTHVGAQLLPAGCLTATVNGTTVTYVFNNCTGPRGLVHLTGTVVVDYLVDTAGIHAHATATNFSVNQSTISIDSTATYTLTLAGKQLTVQTSGSGTGPLGNTFTRLGSYTITWTATCFTLNGSWSTTTALGTRSTQVSSFTRCVGTCPAAGGTIVHTYRTGATLTISFDGSDIAHWSTSTGLSGTVNLPCSTAAVN